MDATQAEKASVLHLCKTEAEDVFVWWAFRATLIQVPSSEYVDLPCIQGT
ncbi:hypothetical protein JOF28_000553 [Leucobacter exalbidus]|uniref:Uncharacterized protein n=1 Tax=Leucobacter exalbidus TaxID=662960 RepID=A0A940T4U8_9MICO|nr:hypothetical protein [Leucobacter exalbidus]